VLHEINMALRADAVVVMEKGLVLHHGFAKDASTHRLIEQVFENRIGIYPLDGDWVALPKRHVAGGASLITDLPS
jgi:iron complex transport system ATP-binding protein